MDGVGVDKEEAGHWKPWQEVASRSSEVWVGLGVLEPEQKETWLEEKASCGHCYRHWRQGAVWSTIKELGRAGNRAPYELVSRIDAMLSKAVWVWLSRESQEIWAHLCSPPCLVFLRETARFLVRMSKAAAIFLLGDVEPNLSVSIFCAMSKQ